MTSSSFQDCNISIESHEPSFNRPDLDIVHIPLYNENSMKRINPFSNPKFQKNLRPPSPKNSMNPPSPTSLHSGYLKIKLLPSLRDQKPGLSRAQTKESTFILPQVALPSSDLDIQPDLPILPPSVLQLNRESPPRLNSLKLIQTRGANGTVFRKASLQQFIRPSQQNPHPQVSQRQLWEVQAKTDNSNSKIHHRKKLSKRALFKVPTIQIQTTSGRKLQRDTLLKTKSETLKPENQVSESFDWDDELMLPVNDIHDPSFYPTIEKRDGDMSEENSTNEKKFKALRNNGEAGAISKRLQLAKSAHKSHSLPFNTEQSNNSTDRRWTKKVSFSNSKEIHLIPPLDVQQRVEFKNLINKKLHFHAELKKIEKELQNKRNL